MSPKLYDLDKVSVKKKILIYAPKQQLNEVKKILFSSPESKVIKEVASDVYQIEPEPILSDHPRLFIYERATIGEITGEIIKKEQVSDFKKSEEFYLKSRSKNSFKIIGDDFSDERNSKLYQGFNLIEKHWRQLVLSNIELNSTSRPESYKKDISDHQISQYSLSEFFEVFLFQEASENYLRKKWKLSDKTEDDVIEMRKLIKLDELNFPLDKNELLHIGKSRNVCMHFRVITINEFVLTLELINKYLKYEANKELSEKLLKIIIPPMKFIEDLNKSFLSIQDTYINSLRNPLLNIAESMSKINTISNFDSLINSKDQK